MVRPAPAPLWEVHSHGEDTVVRFTGCDRLDEYNSEDVGRQLLRLVEETPGPRLVLDLAGIRYLTSTALGKLVSLNRKVRSAGGSLSLSNLCPAVEEVLVVTRLDTLFEVGPVD